MRRSSERRPNTILNNTQRYSICYFNNCHSRAYMEKKVRLHHIFRNVQRIESAETRKHEKFWSRNGNLESVIIGRRLSPIILFFSILHGRRGPSSVVSPPVWRRASPPLWGSTSSPSFTFSVSTSVSASVPDIPFNIPVFVAVIAFRASTGTARPFTVTNRTPTLGW